MFRSLFGPKVLPLSLQPVSGEIYAHVFENPRTGVPRNLFWNMTVELEPVTIEGEEWDCSFGAEWLTWPVRTWRELDGMDLGKVLLPDMVEPPLYLVGEHHPATLQHLRLGGCRGPSFEAAVTASAQIRTEKGQRTIPVSFFCRLQFAGVIVVKENLQPSPTTPALAEEAVAKFMQMDGLRQARSEDWRYVLEPDA
ncbi:MAG: hypothetical protein Q7S93_16910 [Phenylobacterium sp.]|uniref:hypothetical protein n=1 Tax=Phenylobacterium sp. TaxID=1871053 RepID=UPI0027290465|nr:hypothetical protein [Phenylobacterium sp.]MDO8411735.1 hypothetical protein [Phenylobacterium sp.]